MTISTLTGSCIHVRGIPAEDHQHCAVRGRRREYFLPSGFREDRARSGEGKGEEEHSKDLRRGLLLYLRRACGLVLEQDQDRDQEQGSGEDRENDPKEDVKASW